MVKRIWPSNTEELAGTVFLGGTHGASTWRKDLIPKLEEKGINFFNPIVKKWTPECILKESEVKAKLDTVHLYVLTWHMKGPYSVAEVVDASNKWPIKTILFVDGHYDPNMTKSLEAVKALVSTNGARVVNDFKDLVPAIEAALKTEASR